MKAIFFKDDDEINWKHLFIIALSVFLFTLITGLCELNRKCEDQKEEINYLEAKSESVREMNDYLISMVNRLEDQVEALKEE